MRNKLIFAFLLINSINLTQAKEFFKIHKNISNISYGADAKNTFDLYVPDQEKTAKGLIIWIHGGGWIYGDKDDEDLQAFTPVFNKGVAIISANYRLGFNGRFPNSETDIKNLLNMIDDESCDFCLASPAWEWIKKYSDKGIILAGESAGGHLAVWAGIFHLANKDESIKTSKLKCINNNIGLMDFRVKSDFNPIVWSMIKEHANIDKNYNENKLNLLSPTWWIKNTSHFDGSVKKVKWILNYNYHDKIVPYKTNILFTEALLEKGASVVLNTDFNYLEEFNHGIEISIKKKWFNQMASICFDFN